MTMLNILTAIYKSDCVTSLLCSPTNHILLQNKGFFRGLSYPLFSYGIVNSLFFGVYGNALRWLDRGKAEKKSSNLNIYLAGCIGGTAQLVALVPVDLVKVVLQSQIPHPTKGMHEANEQ